MGCPHYRALIADYASGALSPAQETAMERHAAACPDCARELAAERRLEGVLASLPLKTPPAGFTQRVLARTAPARALPAWVPLLAYAASLAALLPGACKLAGLFSGPGSAGQIAQVLARPDLTAVSIPYPGNVLETASAQISGALDALTREGALLPGIPSGIALAGAGAVVCLVAVTWAFYMVAAQGRRWPG